MWRLSVLGCALASSIAAVPASAQSAASFAPDSAAKTYAVTSLVQTPQGNAVVHEALSIQPDGSGYRLFLANADGTTFSSPVTFTPDGIITLDSQDSAVTCYNMAMSVIASQRPAAAPAAVFTVFGSTVVRVPLHVDAVHAAGNVRTVLLTGGSKGQLSNGTTAYDAGIAVSAKLDEDGGSMRDASFEQVQYIGSIDHPVGRSTCTVVKGAPSGAAPAQTPV